jgi:hypothetical protein
LAPLLVLSVLWMVIDDADIFVPGLLLLPVGT